MSPSPYRKRKIAGRTVYEHRLVMERKLGRPLRRDEQVHHKNEQKKDNADDNLEVKTPKEHGRHHFAKNPITKVCEVCDGTFEPPQAHRKRDRACSMRCRDVLIMRARLGDRRFLSLRPIEIQSAYMQGTSARKIGRCFGVGHHTIMRIVRWPDSLAEAVGRSILRAMTRGRTVAA